MLTYARLSSFCELIMRTTLTLIAVSLLSVSAFAAEPSCTAVAAEKKLAGAAKTSFMT